MLLGIDGNLRLRFPPIDLFPDLFYLVGGDCLSAVFLRVGR